MKKLAIAAAGMLAAAAMGADAFPKFAKGFGVRRNVYANGRMSATCSDVNGIFKLQWYGPELRSGRHNFMETTENGTFSNIFRMDAVIDGLSYRLPYENTVHYPCGYRSETTVGGVKIRHELALDGNVVLRRGTVLENPLKKEVKWRIVHSGFAWKGVDGRNRRPRFDFDGKNAITAKVVDAPEKKGGKPVETEVRIGSLAEVEQPFRYVKEQTNRYYLQTKQAHGEHTFYLAFNPGAGEELGSARVEKAFGRFDEEMAETVRFETGNAELDSALNCVGAHVSMLEVEKSGGFKASPYYWVWGWDSMVHMETMALCGWQDSTRRMLEFYKEKSVPGKGIAHAFGPQYQVDMALSPVVQLFYVTLLNGYYQTTGDKETLDKLLPFAREIVENAKKTIRAGELLERGIGFYPDFPARVGHTKETWSLMNNGIYWQGLRAWQELTGEGAEEVEKLGKALVETFWDKGEGYWSDAVVPETGEKMKAFPSYGILHITPFAEDPVADRLGAIGAYQKKHHRVEHGVNMFEIGSWAWMADGNQYGAYYPVTDRGHWNVMNKIGDVESIAALDKIISEHWKTLTYPEGQTLEFANTDVTQHGDEPGNKQAFAAKSWLSDAIELRLGLRILKDGLHFNAMCDGRPYAIRKLAVRGTRLDVEAKGRGAKAKYELNGVKLEKPVVEWAMLKSGMNLLKIECGE